jgi:hypothetical protein
MRQREFVTLMGKAAVAWPLGAGCRRLARTRAHTADPGAIRGNQMKAIEEVFAAFG